MRNAASILIIGFGVAALAACNGKHQQANGAANQDMAIDDNITSGQVPANADIETLPPDESSEASNGELATGQDNPDVNYVGNSH